MNIFKVIGKERRGEFDFYKLRYGGLYNILQKDPATLDEADKFAYYSFKELLEYKESINDMGQVFLKNNETAKAVEYYQSKIDNLS